MIKYRINNEYLDVFTDSKDFAITKQISKIGEIDSRHGDFSTSFKVPLTANNARILRYTPELNNNSSTGQFRRYNGQLVEDDAVISDGYYQVVKFSPTKHEVDIKFFGGNSDWFDLLKDRYINEVIKAEDSEYPYNLDNLEHAYSVPNVVNSWDLNNNLPYYYFFNDNGINTFKDSPVNNVDISEFRLSVFEKVIFKTIFDSVDIKLTGDLFQDDAFNRTIISTVTDIEVAESTQNTKNFTLERFTQEIRGNNIGRAVNFSIGDYDSRWSGSSFTANADGTTLTIAPFAIRISFSGNTSDPVGTTCDLQYSINGANTVTVPLALLVGPSVDFNSFVFENTSTITINLNTNDIASFTFRQSLTTDRTIVTSNSGDEQSFFNYNVATANTFISDVTKYLPKIKQTDFIKDIMFRFGVISYYDVKSRTLTLNKFESVANNKLKSSDWTNRIDLSKDIEVDFTKILSNYAKKSIIDLEDDDNDLYNALIRDVYGFNLGRGVIDINNDFLSDEKDIYTSPYASTLTLRTLRTAKSNPNLDPTDGEFWLPYIPTQIQQGVDNQGDATYEPNEIKPRVLIATGLTLVESFAVNDDQINLSGTNYNSVGYAYFMKPQLKVQGGGAPQDYSLDDIQETLAYQLQTGTTYRYNGIPLLEKNYNLYQKILNEPFYISLYMNLSALDVQQLDFFTPIFLEYQYDSGYYYIDSVEQYKGDGSTTKINLVKI